MNASSVDVVDYSFPFTALQADHASESHDSRENLVPLSPPPLIPTCLPNFSRVSIMVPEAAVPSSQIEEGGDAINLQRGSSSQVDALYGSMAGGVGSDSSAAINFSRQSLERQLADHRLSSADASGREGRMGILDTTPEASSRERRVSTPCNGRVRRMSIPSAPVIDPAVLFGPSMYTSMHGGSGTAPGIALSGYPTMASLVTANDSGSTLLDTLDNMARAANVSHRAANVLAGSLLSSFDSAGNPVGSDGLPMRKSDGIPPPKTFSRLSAGSMDGDLETVGPGGMPSCSTLRASQDSAGPTTASARASPAAAAASISDLARTIQAARSTSPRVSGMVSIAAAGAGAGGGSEAGGDRPFLPLTEGTFSISKAAASTLARSSRHQEIFAGSPGSYPGSAEDVLIRSSGVIAETLSRQAWNGGRTMGRVNPGLDTSIIDAELRSRVLAQMHRTDEFKIGGRVATSSGGGGGGRGTYEAQESQTKRHLPETAAGMSRSPSDQVRTLRRVKRRL